MGDEEIRRRLETIVEWAKTKKPCASHYQCLLADLMELLAPAPASPAPAYETWETPCNHCKNGSIRSRLGWHYWGDGSRSKCADEPANSPAPALTGDKLKQIAMRHYNMSYGFDWDAIVQDPEFPR